ncbi:MAG: CPBP family intramembrane metalloprotease [Oscillospiraceae bacterium]|jgi:membrane protease YdiL (CAAX protease family)|nr:CPBP family intramembrane metalloprotease [Oscillospiraceae bacterium]
MKTNIKPLILITLISLLVCVIHAVLLYSTHNAYLYTSIAKSLLFLLVPVLYFSFTDKSELKKLFAVNKSKFKLPLVLAFAVLAFILIMFALLKGFIDGGMITAGLANMGISGKNFAFVFIYIIFINAFLEEFFFRGFVFSTLRDKGNKAYAWLYSSALFALYHVSILDGMLSPLFFALIIFALFVAGLIFNFLAQHSGNIFGSLIVHIGANIAINTIGVYYFFNA